MQLEVGGIFEGKVTGVKNFGAFVRLPDGKTGMVHISEVSNEYIQELADVLSEGQLVRVKVLSINPDGKVSLSMKRAQENGAGAAEAPQPRERAQRPPKPRPQRADTGRVWQPKPTQQSGNLSFEDMMSRFKTQSEEKISDLRRVTEARRGGSYSRRR
ncbi:MAG: S1 RNA-binding domain-containing protein [Oscillospiraceae bacterium]|jgi:S1 RNA binding domain protein